MKPFDYYSTPETLYPNKKDYIRVYLYDRGLLLWKGSHIRDIAFIKTVNLYPDCVKQELLDEAGYNEHRKQYQEELAKLREEFQLDLFQEFGVTENPKRFKAFDYAWERGHSSGYSGVYGVFSDIVELIED